MFVLEYLLPFCVCFIMRRYIKKKEVSSIKAKKLRILFIINIIVIAVSIGGLSLTPYLNYGMQYEGDVNAFNVNVFMLKYYIGMLMRGIISILLVIYSIKTIKLLFKLKKEILERAVSYCNNCGTALLSGVEFCTECGTKLNKECEKV